MHTNLDPTGRRAAMRGALEAVRDRLASARREDGFLLVEVMMSALLVALIVTATFNGLDVATRLSSEQRHRNQAELLAAQSQEQLRSEPASALDELIGSPHTHTVTLNGVSYKVAQEAFSVAASGKKTGCSVTEATASTAANFRVVSTVTWNQQEKGNRPAVKQAGVISPPTGSGIEVDVINGQSEGVPGVTARAKFVPNESGATTSIEGTTSSAGCVVLSGIQSTEATVEILEKTGFVTYGGTLVPEPRKLTIAPNITTHTVFPYAEAGAIRARFTYQSATSWEGKAVKGDTFVAAQPKKMETAPEYEVGSTTFTHQTTGEENFEALTGTYANSESFTAKQSKYPNGDLFPFSSAWTVYAGDCSANKTSEEVQAKPGPTVVGGATQLAELPLALTKLAIYTGKGPGEPGELLNEGLKPAKSGVPEVKITNTGCASSEPPNNSTGLQYVHTQKETLPATTTGGALENPFQPSGAFSLCIVSSSKKQTYTVSYTNLLTKPSEPTVYLAERQTSVISAERATKESEYKAREAYKEKGGYSNKAAEAEAEKAKYEAEKKNYETALNNYTPLHNKYLAEKTKYETKKTAYENKKKEYERPSFMGGKKASQKTEYEKFKTEYEEAETAYKKYEAEYLPYETEYKKYEAEYKKYETAYKTDETQAAEYQKYLEYVADKAAYEKLKAEDEEATKAGVTVKSGEEC